LIPASGYPANHPTSPAAGPVCSVCRTPAASEDRFCATCGSALTAPVQPAQPGTFACCRLHPTRPAVQPCSRCGNFACAECLVPGREGLVCRDCEARAPTDVVAWDQRREVGLFKAFWRTCVLFISSPQQVLQTLRPEGSASESFLFMVLAQGAGIATSFLLYALIVVVAAIPAAFSDPDAVVVIPIVLGGMLIGLPFVVVSQGFGVLLVASIDHLALKVLGATTQPWSVTMRAAAFAHSPLLIGLFPICGLYVAPIWSLVLKVFTYKYLHRTNWGLAVVGTLLGPFVLSALFVGLYLVMAVIVVAAGQAFN